MSTSLNRPSTTATTPTLTAADTGSSAVILEVPTSCQSTDYAIVDSNQPNSPVDRRLSHMSNLKHKRSETALTSRSMFTLARQNKHSQCYYIRMLQAINLHVPASSSFLVNDFNAAALMGMDNNSNIKDSSSDWDIKIHATFFDHLEQKFFSNTHKSPIVQTGIEAIPQKDSVGVGYEAMATNNWLLKMIDFEDYEMIFHSHYASPNVSIVLEFIAVPSKPTSNIKYTPISIGWTMIPIWNGAKNGLNPLQYMVEANPEMKRQLAVKTIHLPIYSGSPRFLLVLQKGTFDISTPLLPTISNAKLTLELGIDSTLYPITSQLPPMFITSSDMNIPSISMSHEFLTSKPTVPVQLTNISVTIPDEIFSFEESLLDLINDIYKCTNAIIIERRLQLRLHNGISFITSPTMVTLQPSESDPYTLEFTGSISFDKFVQNSKEIVLFVAFEYSVVVNQKVIIKKTGLFRRFSSSKLKEILKSGQEKHVAFGYTKWTPSPDKLGRPESLKISSKLGPNPFNSAFLNPLYLLQNSDKTSADRLNKQYDIQLMFTAHSGHFNTEMQTDASQLQNAVKISRSKQSVRGAHEEEKEVAVTEKVVEKNDDLSDNDKTGVDEELQANVDYSTKNLGSLRSLAFGAGTLLQLTRAQRARLVNAGYECCLDSSNQIIPPKYHEPSGGLQNIPVVDDLQSFMRSKCPNSRNNIGLVIDFSFLGITLMTSNGRLPNNVYFTFQFYSLPFITSDIYSVCAQQWPLSAGIRMESRDILWPAILHKNGLPGVFNLFCGGINSGLLPYICERDEILVEIWDADSHFLIGTASVPLKVNTKLEEFSDIVDVDLRDDVSIGLLHCRFGFAVLQNYEGNSVSFKSGSASSQGLRPIKDPSCPKSSKDMILYDYRQNLNSGTNQLSETVVNAITMFEADKDVEAYIKQGKYEYSSSEIVDDRMKHKLDKIRDIKKTGGLVGHGGAGPEDRQRKYETATIFRDRKKIASIKSGIENQIATTYIISPEYGRAYFFEFNLSNPFSDDITIEIRFFDEDLRIVSSAQEWVGLKRQFGIHGGMVEDQIVNNNQVWLKGSENLAIPFVYQRFSDIKSKKIVNISFLDNDTKKPLAILNLILEPTELVMVDQVYRLVSPEMEYVREKLLYYPKSFADTPFIFVRSSNPVVICEIEQTGINSNAKNVVFKYRCGPASSVPESFYLLFYEDKYLNKLQAVWKIYIHSLYRMDISAALGEQVRASLICRGDKARTLQFWCNTGDDELRFDKTRMDIVGNALNEIKMTFVPKAIGDRIIRVNLIDANDKALVQLWAVKAHVKSPKVTKEFRVKVTKSMQKKISFRNSYAVRKRFHIKSSVPALLSVIEPVLDVMPGKSSYIRLAFHLPAMTNQMGAIEVPGSQVSITDHNRVYSGEEIYITMIDEDEKTLEECLLFTLVYP